MPADSGTGGGRCRDAFVTECLILFIRRDVRYVMTCFRQECMGFVPAVTHIFNIYGNHGACDAESLLRKMRNFAGTAGITVVRLRREERCLSMTVSCRNRWHASNIAAAGNMVLFMRKNYTGIMGAGSNKPVPECLCRCRFIRHVTAEGDIIRQRFLPDILASLADCR